MALQAAGDAPAVRLIHLVVTQALTQAVVVVVAVITMPTTMVETVAPEL